MARAKFETLEQKFTDWVNARALHEPRYAEVLGVYAWAKRHHTKERDNGEPEFIHPLRLALKVAEMSDKMEAQGSFLPESLDLLKAAICHDMLEDKPHDIDNGARMDRYYLGRKIGLRAGQIVFSLSRKYISDEGIFVRKTKEDDHAAIAADPAALLLKHIDRNDNLGTMVYFTRDGQPKNVIYAPDKAKEKFYEAIQFLMQASLPHKVEQNYGPEWMEPMKMVSTDLLRTITKVTARISAAFIHRTIYHPTDYGVTNHIRDMEFPPQLGERPSKEGALIPGSAVAAFPGNINPVQQGRQPIMMRAASTRRQME